MFRLALATSLLALAASNLFAADPAAGGGVKNFLLITVDDMSQDSVGVFGCKAPGITPNIDKLASQGMRFVHGHVTVAICWPTRSVWMTGLYPHRSGGLGFNNIRKDVPTLPEALRKAGWFTGIMAKNSHVIPDRKDAWDVQVQASELRIGRDPHLYYRHAQRFLAAAKQSGKPFFLMANAQDPHRPFAGSEQESGRRVDGDGKAKKAKGKGKAKAGAGRSEEEIGGYPGVSRTYTPDEVSVPGFLPDLPDIRREIAQYYTSVHRADETVGAILRALDESGLADSTLVMFLSDHGMPLPFSKTNCYLHSTRTPWIVRWPGVTRPGSVDDRHMIAGIDLAPTALEALGAPPLAVDGRSFVPLLRGQQQDDREFVFTSINTVSSGRAYPMRSVQDKRFGYIFNAWSDGTTEFRNESMSGLTWKAMVAAAPSDPAIAARVALFAHRVPEEFYDYASDPHATRNLINDPAHQQTIAAFRQRLREQMRATNDPQLPAFEGRVGR